MWNGGEETQVATNNILPGRREPQHFNKQT